MRFHSKLLCALAFLSAVARGAGAQGDTLKIHLASDAAARWLSLVDSALYKVSWDSAASAFRSNVSPGDWTAAAGAARSAVNPLTDRQLVGSEYTTALPDAPPGEYVVLQYSAVDRDARRVVETVTVTRERRDVWRVIGYFIRPQ